MNPIYEGKAKRLYETDNANVLRMEFKDEATSGMGAIHGFEGFKTFSHAKSIFRQAKANVGKLGGMLPPYNKTTEGTIKMQMKK